MIEKEFRDLCCDIDEAVCLIRYYKNAMIEKTGEMHIDAETLVELKEARQDLIDVAKRLKEQL